MATAPPAQLTSSALLALVSLMIAGLAMVVLMVRATQAWLADAERDAAPARRRTALLWTALYAFGWVLVIAALFYFLTALGETRLQRSLGLPLLAAVAWNALVGLLVVFARALTRVTAARTGSVAAAVDFAADAAADIESDDIDDEENEEPIAYAEGPVPAPAARPSRLRSLLGTLAMVLLALFCIALAPSIPALVRIDDWINAHRPWLLAGTITVTVTGFLVLMAGAISLVLGGGRAMDRREIDEMRRAGLQEHERSSRSSYRSAGRAVGASATDEVTFAEMKAAFLAKAWTTSPRWRRIFAMTGGGLTLAVGLFGLFAVIAPLGLKLLLTAAVLYAFVRIALGFARA